MTARCLQQSQPVADGQEVFILGFAGWAFGQVLSHFGPGATVECADDIRADVTKAFGACLAHRSSFGRVGAANTRCSRSTWATERAWVSPGLRR
jgi:hypothetical protein